MRSLIIWLGSCCVAISGFIILGGCATVGPVQDLPRLYCVDSNRNIWRGGQPTRVGFSKLAGLGVTNSLKLDEEFEGLDYANVLDHPISLSQQIGMSPLPVAALVDEADHLQPGTIIHCLHGEDRTGLLVAIYRVRAQGWSVSDAEQEMLERGFHRSLAGLWDCWTSFRSMQEEKRGGNLIPVPEFVPKLSASAPKTYVRTNHLVWGPSIDPSVAGYKVYSGDFLNSETNLLADVRNNTNFIVYITNSVRKFWRVTAYNAIPLESKPGNEAWWPPMLVVDVSGTNLQTSFNKTNCAAGPWVSEPVDSLSITNPTAEAQWWRSSGTNRTKISTRMVSNN